MAVNGGFYSGPSPTTIASYNPSAGGGIPSFPPPAPGPATRSDNVITTSPNGAFASYVRPIS